MVKLTSGTTSESRDEVFRALAHGRRRATLRVLERLGHATPEELAAHLVAAETETALMDVTRAEAEQVQQTLHHVHLPTLTAAGLVTTEDGELRRDSHPLLADPTVAAMLSTDGPDWDAVLDSLADRRRRVALAALVRTDGAMERAELAAAVADALRSDGATDVSADEVRTGLHHVQLPKLDAAGLVTYDEQRVSYEGHPDLDAEWLVGTVTGTPRPVLADADQLSDTWTIDGRENVVAQGQSLFDEAEDELFLMITTDGLLEEECIVKLRDAMDRGVAVYVGSQTASVRDVVRERLPEAVIWEPQMDWLNMAPKQEQVGRLLFADREALMIGTLGADGPDGVPRETALVGIGVENPLVVLHREILGARLDHLDEQSPDFRSRLPL